MAARLLALFAVAILAAACSSRGTGPASTDPMSRLENDTGVKWFASHSGRFGTVDYLQPKTAPPVSLVPGKTPAAAAMAFFVEYAAIFEMNDPAHELALEGAGGPDDIGIRYAAFTQTEGGLPVHGTRLSVQFDRLGRIAFVSGVYVPHLYGFATNPALRADAAKSNAEADFALRYPGAMLGQPEATPAPELVIYPLGAAPELAYRLLVSYVIPETYLDGSSGSALAADRVGMRYIIAANSGAVERAVDAAEPQYLGQGQLIDANGAGFLGNSATFPAVQSNAPDPAVYYMQNYVSQQATVATPRFARVPHVSVLSSPSSTSWDTTPPDQGSAVDAYYNLGLVDQWWRDHNRFSYDDKGATIAIFAHDNRHPGYRAYWDGRGTIHIVPAAYDPDRGFTPRPSSVEIDGMGHEFQHAVNQYSIAFDATPEADTLNESLSDVFGQFVEHHYAPDPVNNFVFGEGSYFPAGYRNLGDPHALGQADNTQDPLYYNGADPYKIGHANTGIPSNAWYLALNGGQNSTSSVTVPQSIKLDWDAAEQLYLSMIQSPGVAPMVDFREFALALVGKAIANSEWNWKGPVSAVACAWYAVGVFTADDLAGWGVDACVRDAGSPPPTPIPDAGSPPPTPTPCTAGDASSVMDNGAAASVYCGLVSASEVGSALGLTGLTGPVYLGSRTDIPVTGVVVRSATCGYCQGGSTAATLGYTYGSLSGTGQAQYSAAQSSLASAGCSESGAAIGQAAFFATCPSDSGRYATILTILADPTHVLIVSANGSSTQQEQSLAQLALPRIPAQ